MPLEDFSGHRLSNVSAHSMGMGGFAAAHLMRMVWHCLKARVKLDMGSEDPQDIIDISLKKLPARELALMIMMVVADSEQLVPLEQKLTEATYSSDFFSLGQFKGWLSNSPMAEAAAAVLAALSNYSDAGGL